MQINGSRDIREILKQGLAVTYDRNLYDRIRKNWDKVAKPLDSMGRFEDLTAKVGAIQGRIDPAFEKSAIFVFCADNGIVEEHVRAGSNCHLCGEYCSRKDCSRCDGGDDPGRCNSRECGNRKSRIRCSSAVLRQEGNA